MKNFLLAPLLFFSSLLAAAELSVDGSAIQDAYASRPDHATISPQDSELSSTSLFERDLRYSLFVPSQAPKTGRYPLIVNLHAYLSSAPIQEIFASMNAEAERRGFIIVYPQARFASWNGGLCCGEAALRQSDDVQYIRDILEDVQKKYPVNSKRIYATGMSNGGFLTHRLGCEAADLFAAIAPVASVLGLQPAACHPQRDLPVLMIHGKLDPIVFYGGGVFNSVSKTVDFWAQANSCRSVVAQRSFSDATCYRGVDCQADTQLCVSDLGGHCWPGNPICPGSFGANPLDANPLIFNFFEQQSLRPK